MDLVYQLVLRTHETDHVTDPSKLHIRMCLSVCVCVCVWREFAWWFWSIAGWWVVVSLCVRSGM